VHGLALAVRDRELPVVHHREGRADGEGDCEI
jgi:hypothetical protein